MGKMTAITAEVDDETLALVDRLARANGRSRASYAAEAIRRVAESEADLLAFVQVGIDAIERGDVVPHEEVMAKIDEMIARHRER